MHVVMFCKIVTAVKEQNRSTTVHFKDLKMIETYKMPVCKIASSFRLTEEPC